MNFHVAFTLLIFAYLAIFRWRELLTTRLGIGNPIHNALVIGGGMVMKPEPVPIAQAWYEWMLIDFMLFSPWFVLGGFAFGATAWSARRHGDNIGERDMLNAGQH